MKMHWRLFSDHRCELGEGSLWHDGRQELFWFDINQNTLFSKKVEGDKTDGDIESINHTNRINRWQFHQPFSAAGIINDQELLLAGKDGLYRFPITTGMGNRLQSIQPIEVDNEDNRLNDGRVAPDGSFWIGSMSYLNEVGKAGAGKIYLYRNHKKVLSELIRSIAIPNSICFDLMDTAVRCYWSDSKDKRIYYIEIEREELPHLKKIDSSEVKVFCETTVGTPDGSVVDEEHCLWNAEWGAGRVVRYDRHGKVVDTISLPVSQPTCPAFVGKDLDSLAITSAYTDLDDEQLASEPMAGMTFIVPLWVRGRREYRIS